MHSKVLFKNSIVSVIIIVSICTFNSCTNIDPNTPLQNKLVFFDLKSFIQNDSLRLIALKPKVIKKVSVNEETETKTIEKLDFAKELTIFAASDINRPAWFDQYKIDSTFNNQHELIKLEYTALRKDLKTQKMIVSFIGKTVQQIIINNISKNLFSDIEQKMIYTPSAGYIIESSQDLILFPKNDINVEVSFLEK